MSSEDKLEDYKKEIRSILIPYQNGCDNIEFNKSYGGLIGKPLPFREMGFRSDMEFLYSMPDVVKITPLAHNRYHLQGIADDKSKHIQKMVARQKQSKKNLSSLKHVKAPRQYSLPPRFAERKPPQTRVFQNSYIKETQKTVPSSQHQPPKLQKEEPRLPAKASPQEEVIALVQYFDNKLAIDDILNQYKCMYNKSLSLSKYGFNTIEECIEEIPELDITSKNSVLFAVYRPESVVSLDKGDKNIENKYEYSWNKNQESYVETSVKINPPEKPPNCNEYSSCNDYGNVPMTLKSKLQMVAERFPDGMLASEFPKRFEEATSHTLELVNLGYRCLSDLLDDVPEIFVRKPVAGSKKDFKIYSADYFKLKGKECSDDPSSINYIVSNLRKLLEAYPEGIKLKDILNLYSINYKNALHIEEFGCDTLDNFLSLIKNRVPLRFGRIDGDKCVHLVKLSDKPGDFYCNVPEAYDKEAIPFGAVFPEFEYKPQRFPADFDFSTFIPVYTSSVAHAGHLHLQLLNDEEQNIDFLKLCEDLDTFYNGTQSDQYRMKPIHIQVGASCIAKWPVDQHWYRAQIITIPSMQNVQVHYVDYGTSDTIPEFLLRYAKKEFIDLPAQAIRCRLAFLKPPNNAAKWDTKSGTRMLDMCEDKRLMAKIEEKGRDGIYSVLLCDTNGEEDIYINDVLCNEGLADCDTSDPIENITPIPEPKLLTETHHNLNLMQALQAQYYLQLFAAVAPSFSQNENYLNLLRQVSYYCQNPDPVAQSLSMTVGAPAGPPGFSFPPSGISTFPNTSTLYNTHLKTSPTIGAAAVGKSKTSYIPPPLIAEDFSVAPTSFESTLPLSSNILPEENLDADNEVFDDDDEEIFQQFCKTVTAPNVRQVKKVMLGDGYKIHIIVVDSEPYASSGDISQLIWNNKEADYLLRRLQLKEVEIPLVTLSEDGHEELFQQLLKYNVKGVQKITGFKSSVMLFPLKVVIKILNLFGHPSVTLRTKLTEEITNFNPKDQHWFEMSPENSSSDDEGCLSGVTDDDKIERLCLADLMAMKETIRYKRKKMNSNTELNKSSHHDEFSKLDRLYNKVLLRIQEIEEICKVFA